MYSPTAGVLTAKIVEWDRLRGYGFLQIGKERVFLHRRDFAELYRAPVVGDNIQFSLGQDTKGRMCAKNALFVRSGFGIGVLGVVGLVGLLLLPVIAALRQGVNARWIGAYGVIVSALTYGAYAWDKRRAREGEWRVSEAQLHLLELLGGWPGALLAQRRLRHKCSKRSYQVVFWLIVLAYQFAAMDSLQHWQLSRAALKRLETTLEHR